MQQDLATVREPAPTCLSPQRHDSTTRPQHCEIIIKKGNAHAEVRTLAKRWSTVCPSFRELYAVYLNASTRARLLIRVNDDMKELYAVYLNANCSCTPSLFAELEGRISTK